MIRSTRSVRQPHHLRKALRLETLEDRRMLAGGFGVSTQGVPEDLQLMSASEITASWIFPTAKDLGSVSGWVLEQDSLDAVNRFDFFQFAIDRDAQTNIYLVGMRQNADIYLIDSAPKLVASSILASSTNLGTSFDHISIALEPGTYSIIVVSANAATAESNPYWIALQADLEPPTTATEPVEQVEPELPSRLPEVPDFGGSQQWGLNAIGAPEAWAAGYTGQGVTVAVIDSGLDLDHADLVHSLYVNPGEIAGNGVDDDHNGFVDDIHGYDFVDHDAIPEDTNGHGTHVTGIIAAGKNGFGATGVAPDAKILPIRVLDSKASGSTNSVAAGIRYAADLGADIINLSLSGGYSSAIGSAIDYARSLGSFIVAAAGNDDASTPSYPGRFSAGDSNVISVGAYSTRGTIAGFSNDVGTSGAMQVDAPGVGIYSTYRGGGYKTMSGTSMAAPYVAGIAALTLSSNPDLTTVELRQLLTSGTIGTASNSDSAGKVNAKATVAYAAAGLVQETSTATRDGSGASVSSTTASSSQFASRAVGSATLLIPSIAPFSLAATASESTVADQLIDQTIQRIADFAVTSGSRQSPIDRYFEALASEEEGQFDTLLGPDFSKFAEIA